MPGMRHVRVALVATVFAAGVPACADIWGFQGGTEQTSGAWDKAQSTPDGAGSGDPSNGADGAASGDGGKCTPVYLPPSVNVDATQWAGLFQTSPIWSCTSAGQTTIDSAAGTISSAGCALGTLDFTNNVAQSTAGASPVMVVRLRGLTVTNNHVLRLQGDKPIIFMVDGNVLVDSGGRIDASAVGTKPGPGGNNSVSCGASTGADNANKQQGGGGGGFGTAGGHGSDLSGGKGAAGGAAVSNGNLQPLRGGCPGGAGGNGAGLPGAGGGAFEISASGTLTIGTGTGAAILSAAGGGSPAVTTGQNVGSGGGGSGGGMLLVSPAPAIFGANGAVRTNGGASGASEGCSCNPESSTDNGQDGHSADNTAAAGGASVDINAAAGANGGLCAGNGCAVASAAGADGTAAQAPVSASGGGGGGGQIRVTVAPATVACE
jgi:hypothetical protein